MVRVGGGWCALDEFLLKNDPCRGKLSFSIIKHILIIILSTNELFYESQYNGNGHLIRRNAGYKINKKYT